MVNLTTKVIDNLQVSISNIHIRYEDTNFFDRPLSMGITLERLSINTTNENWESQFIDRTLQRNKDLPLNKFFDLRNIGFYCNPKDSREMMVSLNSAQA